MGLFAFCWSEFKCLECSQQCGLDALCGQCKVLNGRGVFCMCCQGTGLVGGFMCGNCLCEGVR